MIKKNASAYQLYFQTSFTPLEQFLTDSILPRGFFSCEMASNCHIGSLFFISGSKVAAVFPRGLFDEKSNISPPLIWLRVPMAKFVFVCVCIVFYLCISCLSMCNCICIWSVFVWFHHQASPAAHSPPLLTNQHLPAKLSADRWELAAPFINELQSAWSHSPAPQFWQKPLNFGKVVVPKKKANFEGEKNFVHAPKKKWC